MKGRTTHTVDAVLKFLLITLAVASTQLTYAQQPFQTYDMIVSDPAGVVAALDKYQASPTGEQSTATVILSQYLANGESLATHQILVVYPSNQEMDLNLMRNATSADWAQFLNEMQDSATVEAEGIGQILAMVGDPNDPVATAMGRTNVIYQLNVDDPATYAAAWSDFAGANLQAGNVSYLSSVLAYGTNPGTHVVNNVYSSPGEALSNQPQSMEGFDVFLQRVSSIRAVVGRVVTTVVGEWRP
ncbi:hypothetical protein N9390_06035 [Gammaproteobacteria bacterium]|nr:hypothetical protein [Gammaproteobacteria bacterium]